MGLKGELLLVGHDPKRCLAEFASYPTVVTHSDLLVEDEIEPVDEVQGLDGRVIELALVLGSGVREPKGSEVFEIGKMARHGCLDPPFGVGELVAVTEVVMDG